MRRLALLALLTVACSSGVATNADGSLPDTDSGADGAMDATAQDAPSPPKDAGDGRDDILGTFGPGACPLVTADLSSASPSLREDGLVFVMGETFDRASLSPGGQTLFDTPNAGGSSFESEVMSFEVLHFCEGATLLKTETEIAYTPPDDAGANSITDVLVQIDGKKVGVSVTRAYRPKPQVFSQADAKALLETKLAGVNRSSQRVLAADKWVKQILHVFVADKAAHDAVLAAYPTIDPSLRADTIVLVTQTTGGGFIYCNPDPPLGAECPPI